MVRTSALALALFAEAALAGTWTLDPSHSEVGFRVRHMMVSSTRGKFDKVKGTLELDEQDVTKSKVSVTIEAGSINTSEPKRDEHLRSPDFFDVEKFPTLTFTSTKVESKGGQLLVTGDLSLHGVTKSVTLVADALPKAVMDPWGLKRTGTRATTKLNRKDFGLTWNKALEAGGLVVGEEVELSLEVEFTQAPPAKK